MSLQKYMADNSKTHIIFDFDATLFLLVLPWNKWKDAFRTTLGDEYAHIWDAYQNKDITIHQAQNEYLRNTDESGHKMLTNFNREFELKHLDEILPNTDLLAEIDKLPSELTFYIWSSNSRETIQSVIETQKLKHRFEKIITREDVNLIKPDPHGFSLIYDAAIPKEQYLMVGDSPADKGAAAAAGIDYYYIDYFKNV